MAVRYNRRIEELDQSGAPLKSLFDTYMLFLKAEGKSPATNRSYMEKLRGFHEWLEQGDYPPTLAQISKDRVREFVLHLQERDAKWPSHPYAPPTREKLSPTTIQGYVRVLKTFSSWLFNEDYTDDNILQRYKLPKVPQKQPHWLTHEEIQRLLDAFDRKTTLGARDYAMVLTFLDSGLRCSELCDLLLENADLDVGQLKVLGKGNKERIVPVGIRAVRALRRYRDHFRPLIDSPYFFFSAEGRKLKVGTVQLMIRRAKERANIPRLHIHLLRHSFAIHYLMAGGDVFSLQKILGHATLEVTRMYVNMVSSQVKDKHRLYSPMDNMNVDAERGGPKALTPGAKLWSRR
jgi:site-specific recombinase XerD